MVVLAMAMRRVAVSPGLPLGYEKHAAFRAFARPFLAHFGMHRAGVDSLGAGLVRVMVLALVHGLSYMF